MKWTEAEIDIIRENAGKMSYEKMEALLPGRFRAGISTKANDVGIRNDYRVERPGTFIDITGLKFNLLTAMEYVGNHMWLCKCDCGNTAEIPSYSIRAGLTKSCGCIKTARHRGKYGDATKSNVYAQYKRTARDRGFLFDINKRDFFEIIVKPCAYCGESLGNTKHSEYNSGDFAYTGIDRFDSSLGYSKENCVPCCTNCNKAKNNTEYISFIDHMADIDNHKGGHEMDNSVRSQWGNRLHGASKELYGNYKRAARKKNREFKLEPSIFLELISSSCHYCGRAPSNALEYTKNLVFVYSGIDRVNNDDGYNEENCVPACAWCNKAKGKMTLEEFCKIATRIHDSHIGYPMEIEHE